MCKMRMITVIFFSLQTYGHVSGGHFNPAVTLGAVMLGLKSIPTGILYVIAQFIGAILGYGLLKVSIFIMIHMKFFNF